MKGNENASKSSDFLTSFQTNFELLPRLDLGTQTKQLHNGQASNQRVSQTKNHLHLWMKRA